MTRRPGTTSHFETTHLGKHEIENHEVEATVGVAEEGHGAKPVRHQLDLMSLRLEIELKSIRNVLIVFDQSGSMGETWAGTGGSKLAAATNALEQAFTPLQDLLTAGAIFFPTFACIPALPPPAGGAVAQRFGLV